MVAGTLQIAPAIEALRIGRQIRRELTGGPTMRPLMAAAAQRLASLRLAHTLTFTLAVAALAVALLGPSTAHAASVGADGLRISGSPPMSLAAGNRYSFQPNVSDPTHRSVRYFLVDRPAWLNVNSTTGLVSGSTSLVHNYYGIYVGATDGVDTVYLGSFRIIVSKASSTSTDTVTISGSPVTSVQAGKSYSFQPSAKDSSGKALSFSVRNKPSWASFSIASGSLSGTPAASQTGTYSNVVISASDGTASAALPAFAIAVTNSVTITPPPTITGTPTSSVTAGQSYSFTPTASGPSGDTLTFSIANKPSWASFNASTGQLSGTPSSSSVGSYSNIGISVSDGSQSASLAAFSIAVRAQTAAAGSPVVLYTDVASGPNSGGENNEGAYLSIFGKNFGTTGLGSTVKVYINGVAINNYRYLGPSRGRPDIQQITVQVGSLGNPTPGTALPIKVVVNGVASNTDQTFTVNPGRMLFVSQSGNDATAVPGDISHPYRHVQNGSTGAFDVAKPGDTIVMLGTPLAGAPITTDPTPAGSAWTDVYNGYFVRFIWTNGTAPTGASGSGPIALIAYPNDDVYIYESYASGAKGAITGVDTTQYAGGRYVTVADLRIEAGGAAGVINQQIAGQNWRVVNNEVTAATGSTDPYNLAGGITGNGSNTFWVGNYVHDITSASPGEMHGIYIDGDGSYTVAYNRIEQVTDGTGFQVYVDGSNGSTVANDVVFHHNMVDSVAKYGINIADGSSNGFVYYDNVVYNAAYGCLRFNTVSLSGAKIYNNTFYNCSSHGGYGVVTNDWNLPASALDMENNILYASSGGSYAGGSVGMSGGIGTVTHNLFYNGNDGDSWDAHPISGNPLFMSLSSAMNLDLQTGSPAISAGSTAVAPIVTTDYALTPRSSTSIDIGAYTH